MAASTKAPPVISKPQHLEMFRLLPEWTIVIDPGETCGIAVRYDGVKVEKGDTYFDHYGTVTLDMDFAHDYLMKFIADAHRIGKTLAKVVIEEYRVYPEKAAMHSGKTIPTAEAIGGFKLIARKANCPVVEQPAYIKETTAALLKGRGIKSIGGSRHAMDAEIHMWYYTLRDQIDAARNRGTNN